MKLTSQSQIPPDADARKAVKPVVTYPVDTLPAPDMGRPGSRGAKR